VPIGTVREAVARMGTKQVVDLAIAAGVKPILQAVLPAYGFDEGALWRHSVAAAVGAEVAQNFCQVELPPEAFTTALLHDVGKLVMGRFLSPSIVVMIRHAQEADLLDPLAAESLLLNVNHAELGGRIARRWNLPGRIVQGIVHHHHPGYGRDVICDVTHLANQVAKHIEAGLVGSGFEPVLDPGVAERLGLPPQAMDDLLAQATARFELVRNRYDAV
jgi:HD-like signal output (HDOD) protein